MFLLLYIYTIFLYLILYNKRLKQCIYIYSSIYTHIPYILYIYIHVIHLTFIIYYYTYIYIYVRIYVYISLYMHWDAHTRWTATRSTNWMPTCHHRGQLRGATGKCQQKMLGGTEGILEGETSWTI